MTTTKGRVTRMTKVYMGTIAQQLLYLDGKPEEVRGPNGKDRRAQAAKERRQRKREKKWGSKT